MTFVAAKGKFFPASKKALCRCSNPSLFGLAYIFLRWGLYALPAGLDFYKMCSIRTCRDDVDFKVSNAEVALKDGMPFTAEHSAGNIFSLLPCYLSFISAIFHSPSTFVNIAVLSLLSPYTSARE